MASSATDGFFIDNFTKYSYGSGDGMDLDGKGGKGKDGKGNDRLGGWVA